MPLDHGLVYSGRPGKQITASAILILISLGGLPKLNLVLQCLHTGVCPSQPRAYTVSLACLFVFALGVVCVVSAIRGLPRLTVTTEGIKLQSAFATQSANWNNLGPFAIKAASAGGFNQKIKSASARVIEASSGTIQPRSKTITIPNSFQVPIEQVVADLNATRASALGLDASSQAATFEQVTEHAPAGLTNFTAPWLTFALLAVLVAAFIIENKFAVTPAIKQSPSLSTLFALGALSRNAIAVAGEWYRLFTAPLLHGGIAHLVGNGFALVFGGWLLERLLGRLWFFALFTVSALGGSLVSLAVEPANMISVGASGAITGMFASLLVGSFRASPETRSRLLVCSIRMLVPALIPAFSAGSTHIDYGAHFGGALAGTALTLLLLKAWPTNQPIPQWRTAAATLSVIGAVLFAGSAAMAFANYPKYHIALIPQTELPKAGSDYRSRAAELVARYPGDPRSHLYLGDVLSDAHDNTGAERELRLALTIAQARSAFFGEDILLLSRGALASFLADQGRQEEARALALQTCSAAQQHDALRAMLRELATQHLCDQR